MAFDDSEVRVLVLGDVGCGCRSLIRAAVGLPFLSDPQPRSLTFSHKVKLTKKGAKVKIVAESSHTWQQGNVEFPRCNAVMVCFSLADKSSWESVNNWAREARKRGLIWLLVGCKSDLDSTVDKNLPKRFAEDHDTSYVETSAREGCYVTDVFQRLCEMLQEAMALGGLHAKNRCLLC